MLPRELALLIDAHHAAYTEDLPFWLALAQKQGGPVLELGCGSGRALLPLAEAGFEVVGVDLEESMLALLRERTGGLEERVTILQEDFTQLKLGRQFPLIIIPCNTYSTLTQEQRRDLLSVVQEHLAPGGVFAASMPNPELLAELEAEDEPEVEDTFEHPRDGAPVVVSSAWEHTEEGVRFTWLYDHLQDDGTIKRYSASTFHNLVGKTAYIHKELSEFGFHSLLYGDFEQNKADSDASFLVFTAEQGKI